MNQSTHPTNIANFRIVRLVGQGGMSCVYEGVNGAFRHALKTISTRGRTDDEVEELERRFEAEARIGAVLKQHPNIVQVFNYGRDGGVAYLDMEFIQGRDLLQMLEDGRPPTFMQAIEVVNRVLSALDHAHGLGVIHNDVKPSNVMLADDGQVKLMDFGIARCVEISDSTMDLANCVGSRRFMAPERILGGRENIDPRADLWSVGVLLYLLTTGKHPFDGSEVEVYRQVLNDEPVAPSKIQPTLPPALDKVIAKALSRQPGARFASASDFMVTLAELKPTVPRVPRTRPAKSIGLRGGALLLAGTLLTCVAAWALIGRDKHPCEAPLVLSAGVCSCPDGQTLRGDRCEPSPPVCKWNERTMAGVCVPCKSMMEIDRIGKRCPTLVEIKAYEPANR